MADPPRVSSQQATVQPGGSATLRVGGPPDVPPATPDPTRQVQPDATGLYESEPPTPDWNSSRLLYLNQAGRALVGWFTTPPQFVQPRQDFPVATAVLLADLDPSLKTATGVQFFYRTFDSIEGIDPDQVLSPFDPWDRNDPPSLSVIGTGMIQIQPASDSDGWDYPSPKVLVTLTFTLADGSNSPPLSFQHKIPNARASERTINFQDDSLKRVLIARHRRPLPSSFFDVTNPCGSLWKSKRALFDSNPQGELATWIAAYQADATTSGPGGFAKRAVALEHIRAILTFTWDSSAHAKLLDLLLTRDAAQNTLTIGPMTKSYRAWLSGIAANEIAIRKLGDPDGASSKAGVPQSPAYPVELNKVMGGAKLYRYDLSFSSMSKDKDLPLPLPIIKGAVGAFKLDVRAYSASFSTDGQIPSDDQFEAVTPVAAHFYGAFFEMKVGAEGPPSLPDKVSLYSGEQVDASMFDGAFFDLYALDASVSVGTGVSNPLMSPGVKLESGKDTQLIRVHVHGVVLEGTCESGSVIPTPSGTWSGLHAPSWDTLKKILSRRGIAEDSDFFSFDKPKPKVSLGVSVGLGYIAYQQTFTNWMRPAPRVGPAWKEGGDARTIDACFDRDSSDFTKKQVNHWDVRFLLETVLATDLALFNGIPAVDVEGFASPEYKPLYNLILSKKRANAVLRAIDDAVGPLAPEATTADGRGDYDAVHVAHLTEPNPTGDQGALQQFEQDPNNQEQVSQWPQWRKVTINVRGYFSVHVITVAGDDA